MEKSRRPNVIRTWVVNRNQTHGAQGRPPQPAKFPQFNRVNAVGGTSHPGGAPHPKRKSTT